jgi:hypothetical protein
MTHESASRLWRQLAGEGEGDEGDFWSELLPKGDRREEPVFSPLAPPELALGIETIYEGYLVHYGRSRLFAAGVPDQALLLGDRLYSRGLVRISRLENVAVVADLASLLELCARLRAERRPGDGVVWAAGIAALGRNELAAAGKAFLQSGDEEALLRPAYESAGVDPVVRALAAHARFCGG